MSISRLLCIATYGACDSNNKSLTVAMVGRPQAHCLRTKADKCDRSFLLTYRRYHVNFW